MIVCTSVNGSVSIVLSRTKSTIRTITTIRNRRKITKERTIVFDKYNKIHPNVEASRVASLWLASPLQIALEAKRRLEMIVAMKKNVVIGKIDSLYELPEGAEAITEAGDLKGRTMKSLTALYNKLVPTEEGTKFETEDEATSAVWMAFETLSTPDEKKEKEPKEKKERVKIEHAPSPSIDSEVTVFSCLSSERMRQTGVRYQIYKFIEDNGPSTAAVIAEGLGRTKISVSSDLRCMVCDNKVTCETPEEVPAV